ncbi:MAG: hypothetical protein Q8R25_04345 [bacterium]|nr:hypothetical protein [bacterium]
MRRREPRDKDLFLDEMIRQPRIEPERKVLSTRGLNADEQVGDSGDDEWDDFPEDTHRR